MKINVLPSEIYNKISAGEVVERPASVVKELVENSIDGGATKITVEVFDGGIKKIVVTDNGCGIEPEDIESAFLPHATSKIKDAKLEMRKLQLHSVFYIIAAIVFYLTYWFFIREKIKIEWIDSVVQLSYWIVTSILINFINSINNFLQDIFFYRQIFGSFLNIDRFICYSNMRIIS